MGKVAVGKEGKRFLAVTVLLAVASSALAYYLSLPPVIDPKGRLRNVSFTANAKGDIGPVGVAFNPDYMHVYGTYPGTGRIAAHLVGNSHISLHNQVTTVRAHCKTPRALVHDRTRYHFFFSCAEEHHSLLGHSHESEVDPDNDGIYQVETLGMKVSTAVPSGVVRHPGYLAVADASGEIIATEISKERGFVELVREILNPTGTGRVIAVTPGSLLKAHNDDDGSPSHGDAASESQAHHLRVIASGLNAPVGVDISHDGRHVLVASAADWTVTSFPISGTGDGGSGARVVLPRLPGVPSAVKRRLRGESEGGARESYWVAVRSMPEWFWPGNWVPNVGPLRRIVAALMPVRWLRSLLGGRSVIIEFNDAGEILSTHQDPTGRVSHVTDLADSEVWLHIGTETGHGIFHHKLVEGHRHFVDGVPQVGKHLHDD